MIKTTISSKGEVVCLAGDGDFMMSAGELATAVQYGARFVTVVVDNGSFGTIPTGTRCGECSGAVPIFSPT